MKRKGYALLEVIGILGVLAIMLTVLAKPTKTLVADVTRMNRDFNSYADMSIMLRQLRKDIENAAIVENPTDNLLLIKTTDTSFRCVDLSTGEMQWRWKSELRRSTQLIVGDHVLLFGEFGELGLIELNPDEAVECAMTQQSVFDGERCYAAPALADGRLYLRNEQELVCLDLRPHEDM